MSTKEPRVRVEQQGDVTRATFLDRNILEETTIQQIGEEVGALIDAAVGPKLLLDFSNVEHLSSSALGLLITINNRVRAKGGQLRLANIDPQIYEVFVITQLNRLFQIHADTDKALASFK